MQCGADSQLFAHTAEVKVALYQHLNDAFAVLQKEFVAFGHGRLIRFICAEGNHCDVECALPIWNDANVTFKV